MSRRQVQGRVSVDEMTERQGRAEHKRLAEEIAHHDKLYHDRIVPEISDADYDELRQRLKAIEARFPQLVDPVQPDAAGGAAPDARPSPRCAMRGRCCRWTTPSPMRSCRVRRQAAPCRWSARPTSSRTTRSPWPASRRSTACRSACATRTGRFTVGATRGDGTTGEDVTANLKTIKDIPHRLKGDRARRVDVRGEVYMERDDFQEMNSRQEAAGTRPSPTRATPPPARCASSIPRSPQARPLRFFAYAWGEAEPRS